MQGPVERRMCKIRCVVALRSRKSGEAGVLTATQDGGAGQEAPCLWACTAAGRLWPDNRRQAGGREPGKTWRESGFEQLSYQMMKKGNQAVFCSM